MRSLQRVGGLVFLASTMALVLTGCGGAAGNAEDYPTEPITIVSWSEPGAGTDVLAREAAPFLEEELGQPVSVENITGGSGASAMQEMVSQPADGTMIGVNTRSQMVSLNSELEGQFELDDFSFLAQMQGDPYVLAVQADSGIRDLEDFTEAVESEDQYNIGGFGATSGHSLYTENLTQELGIEAEYVPYDGGSEVVTALLGGNVDAGLTNAGQVIGQVESGDLRVVGISTEERIDQLPDAPTFDEQGMGESFNVTHWRGFYANADTPPEIEEKLGAAFEKLSEDPEWQEYLESSGLTNDYIGPEEEPQFVREDFEEVGESLE